MKTYRSTGFVALAVLAIASLHLSTAAPIVGLQKQANGLDPVLEGRKADFFVHLEKRQRQPEPTSAPPDPKPTPPTRPPPSSSANPRPTAPEPAKPKPTQGNPATTSNSHTSSSSRSSTGATSSGGTQPTSTGSAPPTTTGSGEGTVPTGVSQKVLIGLGTVGGFIVFALGGLAFCRHRKKKNLASALLQQTAQFNNNNPYAKLPEPAAAPKESLPMTPTKPLGTYNVVATYTPALADEIEIGLGDSVTILQEYDDGWCMGVNNTRNGSKGVFPRHCVEMGPYEGSQHGAPGGPHFPPSPSFKATANKRMSSIAPPGGWNDGYNGGYGGPNYPPQPSPQHMGPPQGGGYY
ncbi:hypothetical protein BGZ93_000725 [Podila epicladia]|nr:hypothetical protein BGZ92_005828 [Podila epicladia]KAG0098238.1 hypothetical protein BGZ93_000725 [Podila epicladia]